MVSIKACGSPLDKLHEGWIQKRNTAEGSSQETGKHLYHKLQYTIHPYLWARSLSWGKMERGNQVITIPFSHDQGGGGGTVGVLWHPGTRVLDMDWTRPSRDFIEIAILDFITF